MKAMASLTLLDKTIELKDLIKIVPRNLELIFSILSRMTVYNILFYIYLYLRLIDIYQTSKITLVCAVLRKLLGNPEIGS